MYLKILSDFIICMFILSIIQNEFVSGYTQVSITGNNNNNNNDNQTDNNSGPKVFKALNMDLIFPKVFNATENSLVLTTPMKTTAVTTTASTAIINRLLLTTTIKPTEDTKSFTQNDLTNAESTGRAVDYRPYPFQQLISTANKGRPKISTQIAQERNRPPTQPLYNTRTYVKSRPISTNVYPIYPSGSKLPSRAEIDKLRGKGQAMDRFSPSQAVASALFKSKDGYSYSKPLAEQSQSDTVSSYLPPKDLYSFPPNIHAKYPSPMDSDGPSGVNSYLPPASGPISNHDFKGFVGPVNPDYLPDNLKGPPSDNDDKPNGDDTPDMTSGDDMMGGGGMNSEGDDNGMMIGVDGGGDMDMKNNDNSMPDEHEYPTPPADYLEHSPSKGKNHPMDDDDHSMDSMDHDHPMDNGPSMNQEQPMEHSHPHHDHDIELDHPPHGYHDHPRDHGSFSDYFPHSFPELIYDDHPHHHHHHPTEPPTTTQAPEPPPEPRVKKYSYFYIGRKLWYIPLYFTVWFSFYVLWLILKSVARHKVNLPNHYVSKRSIEAIDLMTRKQANENIDNLTVNVMNKIEQFKNKYL